MWPFKKKAKKPKEFDCEEVFFIALQEKVFNKFPLGSYHEYLGVKLRVYGHQHYTSDYCQPYPIIYPKIYCNYVNKQGDIKDVSFSSVELREWPELKGD